MKRKLYIYIAILMLLLTAVSMWRLRPSMPEGSVMYQRYRHMEGVRVGYIEDFPLNDSISCDVTTFEALTDEGWEQMKEALNLQYTIDQKSWADSVLAAEGMPIENHDDEIDFWKTVRFHPELVGDKFPKGLDSVDCYACSFYYRWVSIYHCENKKQRRTVFSAHLAQIDAHQENTPITGSSKESL